MKKCLTCDQILSDKATKPHCKKCRHKETCLKWIRKNKKDFDLYQKTYREKNRTVCNARSRNSYLKDPKKYNELNKNRYREINGISLDDPFKKRENGQGSYDQGYKTITCPDRNHPNCQSKGRIREHIWVMSQILGRPLIKGEVVHHKNGLRDDNRPENLELCHYGQPPGQRVEDKINYYVEFLVRYGYKVSKD